MQQYQDRQSFALTFPAVARAVLLSTALLGCDSRSDEYSTRPLTIAEATFEIQQNLSLFLDSISKESEGGFAGLKSFAAERNRKLLGQFSKESNPAPINPAATLSEVRSMLARINQAESEESSYSRLVNSLNLRGVFSLYVESMCEAKPQYQPVKFELIDVMETLYLNQVQRRLFEARLQSNPELAEIYTRFTAGGVSANDEHATRAVLDALSLFPADGKNCYLAAVTFSGVATAEERAALISAVLTPSNNEIEAIIRKRESKVLDEADLVQLDRWLNSPLAIQVR